MTLLVSIRIENKQQHISIPPKTGLSIAQLVFQEPGCDTRHGAVRYRGVVGLFAASSDWGWRSCVWAVGMICE